MKLTKSKVSDMKFKVMNRKSGKIQFVSELACHESVSFSIKMGLSVNWAYHNEVDLTGADLFSAHLRGADLPDVKFRDVDLRGADFKGSYLEGADFKGSLLQGMNFKGADLDGADFEGANIQSVDFEGARLRNTKFNKAKCSFGLLKGILPFIRLGPVEPNLLTIQAWNTFDGVYVQSNYFDGSLEDFDKAVSQKSMFGGQELILFLAAWGRQQDESVS